VIVEAPDPAFPAAKSTPLVSESVANKVVKRAAGPAESGEFAERAAAGAELARTRCMA
jgi:hypothetical protein